MDPRGITPAPPRASPPAPEIDDGEPAGGAAWPLAPRAARETIFGVIAEATARASDARLAVLTGGGIAVAVAIVLLGPRWWPIAAAAGAVACTGAYGVASRTTHERTATARPVPPALRLAERTVAVLGATLGVIAAAGILGAMLGTWIS